MNILVKMTNSKEIEKLREIFSSIDKDGTGYISSVELKEALKEANIKYEEHEIESIIHEVDFKGNRKKINYTEFLAATISV
jgi:calcium-dependent protein kinase